MSPQVKGIKGAKCGARTKRRKGDPAENADGTPFVRACGHPAGYGTPHPGFGRCKFHMGSTPNHVVAGEREMAGAAVRTFGLPLEVPPHEALLAEVHRSAGAVAYLQSVVHELDRDGLKQYTTDDEGRSWEKPSVWVEMYHRERKLLTQVCGVAIKCGIEERRVRLAESQGEMLAGAIRGMLAELGVNASDPATATVVAKHLRLVAA